MDCAILGEEQAQRGIVVEGLPAPDSSSRMIQGWVWKVRYLTLLSAGLLPMGGIIG